MISSRVTSKVADVLVHYDNGALTCLIKLCRQKKKWRNVENIFVYGNKVSIRLCIPTFHFQMTSFFLSCRRQNCSGVRGIWTWSRDQRCHVCSTRSQFTRHSLLYFLSQKTCKCLEFSSSSRSEGISCASKAKQTFISKSVEWSLSNFMSSISK